MKQNFFNYNTNIYHLPLFLAFIHRNILFSFFDLLESAPNIGDGRSDSKSDRPVHCSLLPNLKVYM